MNNKFSKNNILVFIGPNPDDAIGENLIKLPFLRGLSNFYPKANITWSHGNSINLFGTILEPLSRGLIHEFLPTTKLGSNWKDALNPTRLLPERHFDLIIDTQQNPLYTMILRRLSHDKLISSSWRYLFSHKKPDHYNTNPVSLAKKMLLLLSLATGNSTPPDHRAELPIEYIEAANTILPEGPIYVGLAPGAGRTETGKCWPLENYIAIARKLLSVGKTPLFFLGPMEQNWMIEIKKDIPEISFAPLIWESSKGVRLEGPALTVALGRRLSASVANCSGTGHMLAAGGSRMLSLFGPTDPKKFMPFTPHVQVISAQEFGSDLISIIPVQVVYDAIHSLSSV